MKKVILFENRPERQKIYLPNGKHDVEKLRTFEFLTLYDDQEHGKLLSKGDFMFLNDFDLLIFHRSYLVEFKNGSKLNPIFSFCKQESKDLILFTGGVSSSAYIQENDFQSLTINAKEFYLNIMDFLQVYYVNKGKTYLLELKYGKNWELVFMLQFRELLTMLNQDDKSELKVIDRFNYLVDLLDLSEDAADKQKLRDILNEKIKLSLKE
jgi:hypothetical protein